MTSYPNKSHSFHFHQLFFFFSDYSIKENTNSLEKHTLSSAIIKQSPSATPSPDNRQKNEKKNAFERKIGSLLARCGSVTSIRPHVPRTGRHVTRARAPTHVAVSLSYACAKPPLRLHSKMHAEERNICAHESSPSRAADNGFARIFETLPHFVGFYYKESSCNFPGPAVPVTRSGAPEETKIGKEAEMVSGCNAGDERLIYRR